MRQIEIREREIRKQEIRNEEIVETRKDLAGENLSNLFFSSTWLQLVYLTCRSLPVDRAFRLTVSSLLASMSRPVIDLTIDLTKADSPSDSDDPGAVDRGSSSDSCIVISDDGMR